MPVELPLGHLAEAGKALFERGKADIALDFFALAAELAPEDPNRLMAHASALRAVKRPAESEAIARRAFEIQPTPHALTIQACAMRDPVDSGTVTPEDKRAIKDKAEGLIRDAVDMDQSFADSRGLLGIWLLDRWHRAESGDDVLDEALDCIDRAIELAPDNLHFKAMRLAAMQAQARYECVVADATDLIDQYPGGVEFHLHRGAANLALGNHRDGWPEMSQWAYKLPRFKDFPLEPFPRWWPNQIDAVREAGIEPNVLVWNPEGAGDYFMLARYFARMAREGWRVKPISNATMKRLFEAMPSVAETVAPDAQVVDQHLAPIMTLPAAYTLDEASIPWEGAYLGSTGESTIKWLDHLRHRGLNRRAQTIIGIAWKGNPQQGNDQRRSFTLEHFAPIYKVPGVTLVSIQKGERVPQGWDIVDLGDDFQSGDWLDTAGVIANLDLVIAPCTGVAHLAGAMGKPVWLALSDPGCWRWGRHGETTPWYPSMRIFRQRARGVWDGLFERMAGELAKLARAAA
jgi:tetratricopeptide (TPR) repeat protein